MRLAVFCLLLLTFGTAAGQSPVADSLRQQLAASRIDTSRALLLSDLCSVVSSQNAVQAVAYGQQALALARRLDFRFGEVNSLNALAQAEHRRQNYVATTRYYQQAVRIAEREPRAARALTVALIGLGRLAAEQEEFVEVDNYFRLAISRMQQRKPAADPLKLIMGATSLGTLYLG